jgi:hypothetical protein
MLKIKEGKRNKSETEGKIIEKRNSRCKTKVNEGMQK